MATHLLTGLSPKAAIVLLLITASVFGVAPAASGDDAKTPTGANLTLWNGLGGVEEVENSFIGPDLAFFDPLVDSTAGGKIGAVPAFMPGVVGNGLTAGGGPYPTFAPVQNVILRDPAAALNAERGTIDVSFTQNADPVPAEHNIYRIFDGPYGSGHSVEFFSAAPRGLEPIFSPAETRPRLMFGLVFGRNDPAEPQVYVSSVVDGRVGVDISARNGEWLRLTALWDRAGIDGSADTIRLYIDGELAATTTDPGWRSFVTEAVDIGGGNDDVANRFAVDELRIYDAPLPPPLPTCNGLEATIVGSDAADTVVGTERGDVIAALGGADRIYGMGGDDHICGGPGDDILRGNSGNDVVIGDDGHDQLFGGLGHDALLGGVGADRIFGGPGADSLDGGRGADLLDGGVDHDVCDGGPWIDEIRDNCETAINP